MDKNTTHDWRTRVAFSSPAYDLEREISREIIGPKHTKGLTCFAIVPLPLSSPLPWRLVAGHPVLATYMVEKGGDIRSF